MSACPSACDWELSLYVHLGVAGRTSAWILNTAGVRHAYKAYARHWKSISRLPVPRPRSLTNMKLALLMTLAGIALALPAEDAKTGLSKRCYSNADCLKRGLPLLKPARRVWDRSLAHRETPT
jgi:hypothetical protein